MRKSCKQKLDDILHQIRIVDAKVRDRGSCTHIFQESQITLHDSRRTLEENIEGCGDSKCEHYCSCKKN